MKTLICVYIAIDYQPRFIHTFAEQVEFIADIFPLKKGPYQFYKPHYFIFHLLQIFVQDTNQGLQFYYHELLWINKNQRIRFNLSKITRRKP